MRNPWLGLPKSPPYVLPADLSALERFNLTARPEHVVHLDALPEPYLGLPDAPIVLLNLNPGYDPRDAETHRLPHFRASYFSCLNHENHEYPFYLLDPRNAGGGHSWWIRKLRPLLLEFPLELVARKLFCVEIFPYHSVSFAHRRLTVAGTPYAASLISSALDRRAHVVAMRGLKQWEALVPALIGYDRLYRLNSAQNVTVSANNCPMGFSAIRGAIQGIV